MPRWWRICRRRRSTRWWRRRSERAEVEDERDLDHRDLRALTLAMLDCYRTLTGRAFPADPQEQLAAAAAAVFRSWDAPKAASYRRLNGISDEAGTAVTVQTMVFGNAGGMSGAGVAFTRNPATGARELYFDFQFNAQGEDVVAGRQKLLDNDRLRLVLPAVWARLNEICHELEMLFGDAQDFEFTVQSGVLFLLQTRRAKRTDWAALAIAVDMVEEGLLDAGRSARPARRHRPELRGPHQLRPAGARDAGGGAGGQHGRGERRRGARLRRSEAPDGGGHTGDPGAAGDGDDGYRGHGLGGRDPHRLRAAAPPMPRW